MDRVEPGARSAFYPKIVEQNDAPLFEGTIEHLFTRAFSKTTEGCPRCHAPTQVRCAHFIYATDAALRVMLAPAGFFCTACPTVIIDEELVKTSMKPGLEFRGVVGIDYANTKPADVFKTCNGQKAVYILDENGGILGLETLGNNRSVGAAGDFIAFPVVSRLRGRLIKSRRQMAKQSRKRNRRR